MMTTKYTTRRTLAIAILSIGGGGFTSSGDGAGGSFPPSMMLFANAQCTDPCVPGSEDIMKPKAHGTSEYPVVRNERSMKIGRELSAGKRI